MRIWILAGLLAVAAVVAYHSGVDTRMLADAAAAVHPAVLFTLYVLAVVLLLPLSPFPVAAGFSLGFWAGSALALAALNGGSLIAFWLGKYLLRDYLHRAVEDRRRFARAMDFVSRDQLGDIVLLRINPLMPFNLHNYLYGAFNGEMSLVRYLLGTFLGSLPVTALLVYLGFAGRLLLTDGSDSLDVSALLAGVGLLCTFLLVRRYQRFAEHRKQH